MITPIGCVIISFDAEKERKRLRGGRFGCCEEKSKAYRVDGISPWLCRRLIQCSFLGLHTLVSSGLGVDLFHVTCVF